MTEKKRKKIRIRLTPVRKRYLTMLLCMLTTTMMVWFSEAWYSKNILLIVSAVLYLAAILFTYFTDRDKLRPIILCATLCLPALIGFTIGLTIIFPAIAVMGCITETIGHMDKSFKWKTFGILAMFCIAFPSLGMIGSFFFIKNPPVWMPFFIILMAIAEIYLLGSITQDENMKAKRAVSQANSKANHDKLTGLLNRQTLEIEAEQLGQRPGVFSLIMMDIDNFKKVNDTYGHTAGDEILADLAGCVRQSIRGSDKAFRYGGEEFCVLCAGADAEQAIAVAERIRTSFNNKEYTFDGNTVHFSISLGVSDCRYGEYETLVKLVEKSDSALYEAKHNGKNRTEVYQRR